MMTARHIWTSGLSACPECVTLIRARSVMLPPLRDHGGGEFRKRLLHRFDLGFQSGKPIIFQHPHHLVAELFSIVGINAVATIVFAKF